MKTGKKQINRLSILGVSMLMVILGVSIVFLSSSSFSTGINMSERLQKSSSSHLLGTDELGRDRLSCVVYGILISFALSVVVVLISGGIGSFLGMLAGLAGGVVDRVIMWCADIILAFPGILLAMAAAAFFKPGPVTLVLILIWVGWAGYARLARAETLKYKHRDFITAAKGYNASMVHIVTGHLIPLVLPLLIVQASLDIPGVIMSESGLDYLGIGLGPHIPSLGQLISNAQANMFSSPEGVIIPGAALSMLIISVTFMAEGLKKRKRKF